jgi:hypothetical protein
MTALAFNLCMLVLPLACAVAVLLIGRDHLYAYEYSEAGARAIATRVERLNAELIQLDFDRYRQWDDLIAMEVMAGDISAARGFLLSGGRMLPSRYANPINRAASRGDPAIELAALDQLTPGTRGRYESIVPLLSRRAQSVSAEDRAPGTSVPLGDQQDFELMARALIAEPESDPVQFILTGFSLGLAGEFSPRANDGAVALVAASRRADYPPTFSTEMQRLLTQAVSIEAFRTRALASTEPEQAGAYDNAAAAFRASINPMRATQAREALEQIGAMAEAISVPAAADLISHAAAMRDLPRLRLVAQAAGDRAAAAAKRLPRDGRLIATARGDLTVTRELAITLAIAGLALFGLLGIVGWRIYQAGRRVWVRAEDDDDGYGAELVDMGGAGNWRPL